MIADRGVPSRFRTYSVEAHASVVKGGRTSPPVPPLKREGCLVAAPVPCPTADAPLESHSLPAPRVPSGRRGREERSNGPRAATSAGAVVQTSADDAAQAARRRTRRAIGM